MRADELQRAATKISQILKSSDVMDTVRGCRGARAADEQERAQVALSRSGTQLMAAFENLSPEEQALLEKLHLHTLRSAGYWRSLLADSLPAEQQQAELVHLYSRVMFATSHLPALISLLGSTTDAVAPPATSSMLMAQLSSDESPMVIRLSDAGELAGDPDRIARAIDGIDMLYSASATLGAGNAIDLTLHSITGDEDRNLTFAGQKSALQAVMTIVDSIPDLIEQIDPSEDIDVSELVYELPIFDDLETLKTVGTFSHSDLEDIYDTIHQGALLCLESGVVVVEESDPVFHQLLDTLNPASAATNATSGQDSDSGDILTLYRRKRSGQAENQPSTPEPDGDGKKQDEYFEQYLRERERMESGAQPQAPRQSANTVPYDASKTPEQIADERDNAIDNLLKGLGKK